MAGIIKLQIILIKRPSKNCNISIWTINCKTPEAVSKVFFNRRVDEVLGKGAKSEH
jgi:hypothetical protein